MALFGRHRSREHGNDWQRWCDRFDFTHNGVIRLFHDRAIWRTIRAMIDSNPAVEKTGFAENWLAWTYTTTQLIGIRRECGANSDSIGIRRSLNSLASSPRMATRTWYHLQLQQRGAAGEDPRWSRLVVTDYLDHHTAPGRTDLVRVITGSSRAVVEFAPRAACPVPRRYWRHHGHGLGHGLR